MSYKSLIFIACLYSVAWAYNSSSCNKGLTKCYSKCVDLSKDVLNCGKCGYKCGTNKKCTKGKCASSSCPAGAHLSSQSGKCVCTAGLPYLSSFKQSSFVNFEKPTYNTGTINNQDGWKSAGASGPGNGCAFYDHAVASSTANGFKMQSLRVSNAVTSGCFSDQTFAKPIAGSVGESTATAGTFTKGTRMTHFEMQFDILSASPNAQQPGLFVSVSPDRGDGSRMSYLGFEDTPAGINVIFYDVQGTANPANFVSSTIATGLDRTKPHRIRLTLDVKEGPSNDVVKVYIDCKLVKTGTSWENYYRYDSEAKTEQTPRLVKTVLFRSGGTAAPGTAGKGFFFDNLTVGAN